MVGCFLLIMPTPLVNRTCSLYTRLAVIAGYMVGKQDTNMQAHFNRHDDAYWYMHRAS